MRWPLLLCLLGIFGCDNNSYRGYSRAGGVRKVVTAKQYVEPIIEIKKDGKNVLTRTEQVAEYWIEVSTTARFRVDAKLFERCQEGCSYPPPEPVEVITSEYSNADADEH